ncbi:MAG: hypothetical protein H0W68_03455 [Gemmatimonadaceae bacterium]|nr:hypothetical protein [Gemmatimonadaceae bacterium]
MDGERSRLPDATARNATRVVGDVDVASVRRMTPLIVPAPHGAGPMAVATRLMNTVRAAAL